MTTYRTPLDKYMSEEKLKDATLASIVGRDRSTISKLRTGDADPSLDLALAIESYTKGRVPVSTWKKPHQEARA